MISSVHRGSMYNLGHRGSSVDKTSPLSIRSSKPLKQIIFQNYTPRKYTPDLNLHHLKTCL